MMFSSRGRHPIYTEAQRLHKMKPQMNADEHRAAQPQPKNRKKSHHKDTKIHTGKNVVDSSCLRVFVVKTGCVRFREDAEKSLPGCEEFSR